MTDYIGPNGGVRGRPPLRGTAKRQVTLRLDPDVIEKFRGGGPGRQARMNEALRKAARLG
ncbi:BrnA antitoxin family protein [Sphingomonas sp. ABOLG]|uniref:BrnA antitoxin family protein n=1 Tax=Sphingomonas sp. ABOLG TaxID=1985880 RepID=UPI001F49936F|nr:BrnA antitoxin family protein [Sphingomonas sp. ABOLG]